MVGLVIGLCVSTHAKAQVMFEDLKIIASDAEAGVWFGEKSTVDTGILLIGSRHDNDNGTQSGSAYLVDAYTGNELFKLLAFDGEQFDLFGSAVAIRNGLAVVGSRQDNDHGADSGAVYLFDATTGMMMPTPKITPADGAPGDHFGGAVAIDQSGTIAVAAWHDDDAGTDAGSVYLYDQTGTMLHHLLPPPGSAGAAFGNEIAVENGVVVVGAARADDNGTDAGLVYLFDTNTGMPLAAAPKLQPDDPIPGQLFGISVAADANLIAVGAYFDTVNGPESGAAYVFDATTGQQISKLIPDDGVAFDRFGSSIAIEHTIVAVGAYLRDDNATDAGAVYIFDATTGNQLAKLLTSDATPTDFFGWRGGMDRGILTFGAYRHSDNGPLSGAAYVFHLCRADVNHDGVLDATDFTGWISAFNAMAPECDQNGDDACDPSDFTAWLANFNAGCP